MRFRTTLVLLLLVAALCGALYFLSEKPEVQQVAQNSALDGRALREMKRMRWQFADRAATEIEIDKDGVFQLTEPLRDRAAMSYLQQIMSAWDSAVLIATDYKDDAAGRAETGLDMPELQFSVEWPDGHKVAYDVGKPGPLGDDRFLRRDGKIWRGGQGIYESLRVGLDDLRDRMVFRTRENLCGDLVVDFLSPTGARERLHLVREGAGSWRLVEPVKGRADTRAAITYVTAVLSMRADTFLPGAVLRPERAPEVVITCKGGFGEEQVEMWVEKGTPYGRLPGRVQWFQCEPRNFQFIFDTVGGELRATALVPFENVAENLAEVIVDPGQGRGDRIRLQRPDNTLPWQLEEPIVFGTHPSRRAELITAVNNLRALEFCDGRQIDDPALGLGPGRLQIGVRGFADKKVTTLWIGADVVKNEACCYACAADEPGTIVLVPKGAVDELKRAWTIYCALDVQKITVPVERLGVKSRTGGERTYHATEDARHWVCDGKEGFCDDVRDFVQDDLRDIVGKGAVDLRPGKTAYGEPDHVLSFQRASRDELTFLKVWDRGPEAPMVLQPKDGENVGFVASERVAKSLRELWQ